MVPGDVFSAQLEFQARSLGLVQKDGERRSASHGKREIGEALLEWIARVVAHACDFSALAIRDGEGFQDVVHVIGLEIQPGDFAGLEISRALNVRYSVFIKCYVANR